jgi:hypothetical protein
VLSESVEQGGSEFVVDKDAIPFAEGEVAGHDGGAALVSGREHVEEQLSAGLLEGYEPELVDLCEAPHKSTHVERLVM